MEENGKLQCKRVDHISMTLQRLCHQVSPAAPIHPSDILRPRTDAHRCSRIARQAGTHQPAAGLAPVGRAAPTCSGKIEVDRRLAAVSVSFPAVFYDPSHVLPLGCLRALFSCFVCIIRRGGAAASVAIQDIFDLADRPTLARPENRSRACPCRRRSQRVRGRGGRQAHEAVGTDDPEHAQRPREQAHAPQLPGSDRTVPPAYPEP